MPSEEELRARLRKIEALFAGAGTPGEKAAAGAAMQRIKERLREAIRQAPAIEMQFSIQDPWARQLFLALTRRYGLKPYRHWRQRSSTVMVRAPRQFLEEVLWPEFQELNAELTHYLAEVTERIIREEVHGNVSEAEEHRTD